MPTQLLDFFLGLHILLVLLCCYVFFLFTSRLVLFIFFTYLPTDCTGRRIVKLIQWGQMDTGRIEVIAKLVLTALHCNTLNITVLHCIALPCTALNSTALHFTVLQCTALHHNQLYFLDIREGLKKRQIILILWIRGEGGSSLGVKKILFVNIINFQNVDKPRVGGLDNG